jgi:DNA-directed RNA polymerase specialized sigma subunit
MIASTNNTSEKLNERILVYMATVDPQAALEELQATSTLSILHLAEPYLTTPSPRNNSANKRSSNTSSNEGRENATPAILAADLAHYQELFSKLRFSYVEQVTKERFLRAITAEQPEFVDPNENVELEEQLKEQKSGLKEKKQEVRELVKELEEQGRQLAASKSSMPSNQDVTTFLQAL